MESWAVPLGALVVSVGALLYATLTGRQKADLSTLERSERVTEAKIASLETEVARCHDERDGLRVECDGLRRDIRALRDENIDLMKRVLRLENGKP